MTPTLRIFFLSIRRLSGLFVINERQGEIEEAIVSKYYLVKREELDDDIQYVLANIGADRGDYDFNGETYCILAQYAIDSADSEDIEKLNELDFASFISMNAIEV